MIRFLLIAVMLGLIPCFAADYTPEPVKDELVESTLQNVSDVYPKPNLDYDYNDNFVKTDRVIKDFYAKPLKMEDKLVRIYLKNVSSDYPEPNLVYDYTKIKFLPLRIRFLETISTKGVDNTEGQIVKFVVVRDIYDGKRKLVSHGTIGTARVETISPRGFMGVPADLIISHFEVEGLDKKKIEGDVVKSGYNLMGLAGALKYSIGTFIPGTGYLFMLIKGGQAKIDPAEIFEIKYVP